MTSQHLFLLHPVAWSVCQEVLREESHMIASGQTTEQRIAYITNERDRLLRESDVVLTEALNIALSDWDSSTGMASIDETELRFQLHGGSFSFRRIRAGLRQLGLPDNVLATPLLGFGLLIIGEDPDVAMSMQRLFQQRLQTLVEHPHVSGSESQYQVLLQDASLLPSMRDQAITRLALSTLIGMSDDLESLFTFDQHELRDLAVVRGALLDLHITDLMATAIANGYTSELRTLLAQASKDGIELYRAVVNSILGHRVSELSAASLSILVNSATEDSSTSNEKEMRRENTQAPPADAKNSDHLMTIGQAMELLSVSRATLWRLEKEGTLLPIRIGRSVRYERTSIDSYLGRK